MPAYLTEADHESRSEYINTLMALFRGRYHRDFQTGRWWSRDPESGQWRRDPRGRFRELNALVRAGLAQPFLSAADQRTLRYLWSTGGEYWILGRVGDLLDAEGEPDDFRTNRAS